MESIQFDESQLKAIATADDPGDCIITGGAGTGKCLGYGTKILMINGTIQEVQDIRVGAVLKGPDSLPRRVLSTTTGEDEMFKITPRKGDAFCCNRSHILSVKYTKKLLRRYVSDKNQPFNISVDELLKWPEKQRAEIKLWRTGVEFSEQDPLIDPYFLGLWLGDGTVGQPYITKPNPEIYQYLKKFAEINNLHCDIQTSGGTRCPTYRLTTGKCSGKGKYNRNPITTILREIGVFDSKHIPDLYKTNSRRIRLALLAGLIDSDGYVYSEGRCCELSTKILQLAHDILFLARSLGLAAYEKVRVKTCTNTGKKGVYSIIQISGKLDDIPTIIPSKKFYPRRQIKSVLHTSAKIESIGKGKYYGFTLYGPGPAGDDDGLFLLGDFTVTHNTTIIKAVADQMNGHCEIMAPTGKAAARLKEATGYPACTIHRLLLWDSEKINRKHDFDVPIIIDESSMVDAWLMAQLLEFHPPKIIMVGDAAQLAPVGKGQPFHDLINLRPDMVVELQHCWRAQGAVHKAAQAIRQGESPMQIDNSGGESWRMIETGEAENTTAKIMDWVKRGALDFTQDIILAPTYGDGDTNDGGIDSINRGIREIVNPSPDKFARGDRVICCKNFGTADLWNGDLGTIGDIDTDGCLYISLDRDPTQRLLEKAQIKELKYAYCLSVHKAQGSQFRRVVFICLKKHWYQLSRSLIYTAITRAMKGACVIGEGQAFFHGINTIKTKTTCLQIIGGNKQK